jgi:hypothetical protein
MAKKTTIDEVAGRFERVATEGLAAAQDGAEALVKATEAQLENGIELLKKSADTLKGLRDGELVDRARNLVDSALDTARNSADTWLEFAQHSLGNVRKVVNAAIGTEKRA